MPPSLQALGIDRLGLDDRLTLVQEVWDSIAAESERASLTEAQKREIDRRLTAHASNPGAAILWEQVEADALARLRSW